MLNGSYFIVRLSPKLRNIEMQKKLHLKQTNTFYNCNKAVRLNDKTDRLIEAIEMVSLHVTNLINNELYILSTTLSLLYSTVHIPSNYHFFLLM